MPKKGVVIINSTIRNGRIFSGFFYLPLGMLFTHLHTSEWARIMAVLVGSLFGDVEEKPLYSLIIGISGIIYNSH